MKTSTQVAKNSWLNPWVEKILNAKGPKNINVSKKSGSSILSKKDGNFKETRRPGNSKPLPRQ